MDTQLGDFIAPRHLIFSKGKIDTANSPTPKRENELREARYALKESQYRRGEGKAVISKKGKEK